MNKGYTVRRYREGDEEDIVKLLVSVFDGWPHFDLHCSPLDHWKWKYEQTPTEMNSISVAVCQGKIIGVDHSLALRVKIGDKIVPCHYSADTVVHLDFRRRGVSREIINLHEEIRSKHGIHIVYFVTNNPIMIRAWSRTYPRFPKDILNLVRLRDINLQLRKMPVEKAWLTRLGFRAVKLFNDFRNVMRIQEDVDEHVDITKISRFDSRIDEFWDRISKHYDFIIMRNQDYMNWRYCDPRGGGFTVKMAECDRRVLGYSVLRVNKYNVDYPIGFIVDLLALPDRRDVTDALVEDAVRYFDDQNINLVSSLVTRGHPNERSMSRYGFLNSWRKLHMFCWSREAKGKKVEFRPVSVDNAHFSYGDIDGLP